ncbi:MAG: hypothetical protein ACK2UK_07285 [Candidatus Promineifilaceae bacterium]|jgi:lysine biosynthesis protein LysW
MSLRTKREITATCPGCGNEIYFHEMPRLGQFVTCPECGDMTEVISLDPVALDWSSDWEDEEWEDDWEYEGGSYDEEDELEDFDNDEYDDESDNDDY